MFLLLLLLFIPFFAVKQRQEWLTGKFITLIFCTLLFAKRMCLVVAFILPCILSHAISLLRDGFSLNTIDSSLTNFCILTCSPIHRDTSNLSSGQFPAATAAIDCDLTRALAMLANNLNVPAMSRCRCRPNPIAPIWLIYLSIPVNPLINSLAIPVTPDWTGYLRTENG